MFRFQKKFYSGDVFLHSQPLFYFAGLFFFSFFARLAIDYFAVYSVSTAMSTTAM